MSRVATITPVLNDGANLRDAVESILSQAAVDHVVLAVGPSSDSSLDVAAQLAREDERVLVIENPAGRTAAALNLAIAATNAGVIVRVDSRAVLPSDYVEHALETLASTGAGNVGAVQNPVGHSRTERAIASAMRSRAGSGGVAYRGGGEARPVDTAWLGVFRRSALDEVGGYDERFIRNQDAELNIRLNKAGHQVWFDPRLVVDYRPRPTLRKLARQYFEYGQWRFRTIRKHPDSAKLRQMAAPVIVVGLLLSVLLAFSVSPFIWVVPAVYVSAVVIVGLYSSGPVLERLLTAAALLVMHLSWGSGFLLSALQRGST